MKSFTKATSTNAIGYSTGIRSNDIHLLVFIVLLICLGETQAREWYATPYAKSRLIFDSNHRLRPEQDITTAQGTRTIKPKQTVGGMLQAGGVLGSQTENSDIHLRGHVSFNRYSIDNFNSTDFYLFPETWLTVSPRDKLGISGKLFLDTTLARERPDIIDDTPLNLDETDDLLGTPKRRFMKSIRPEWNRSLSEKTALNLSYDFTDVTYENASKTGRVDYSSHSGQLNLSHQLTPKMLLFSNTSATLFSTPAIHSSTIYYSLQAGTRYHFSERWEAEVALGGRYSQSDFRTQRLVNITDANGNILVDRNGNVIRIPLAEKGNNSGFGSLAYASLAHNYATGRVRASVTQDIRPTGNGDLQTSNSATISWTHRLSERLNLRLPVSALRASSINSDTDRLNRTIYQVSPALNWKFTPELSLGLSYRYRHQKRDQTDNAAEAHSAVLSANYHWKRRSLSR
jgi:hypothetical protein